MTIKHRLSGWVTRDISGWIRIHNTTPVWIEQYQRYYSNDTYIPNYMLPPYHFAKEVLHGDKPKRIDMYFELKEEEVE